MEYMANRMGAWQVGNDPSKGKVEFKIFFPEEPDPEISSIRVAGDFLNNSWNFEGGFLMNRNLIDEGTVWSYRTETELDSGYYQYKYFITFNDGSTRIVSDPCTRYSGRENQNAAFVIGGSQPSQNVVLPLVHGRKPLKELMIYELNIFDFVSGYNREKEAPVAAVIQKLDYIREIGFNAILFMPWTAWNNAEYSWGYVPFQYFAVEYLLANNLDKPSEKLSFLKKMISECHQRDIHVIMDGVYNHVSTDFPYKLMYSDPEKCPFTGSYGGAFPGLEDLDFDNQCTNDFILDVCSYWIDIFKIDGIRFDNTVNFYQAGDTKGLGKLLGNIAEYVESKNEENFSLTLEHISIDAINVVNNTKANSFWDNALYEFTFNSLWWKNIDSKLLNALNNRIYLEDAEKVPTLYIGNHDHSSVAYQAGARDNEGSMRWYKTQPFLIALFTSTAVPLVQSGAEFGEDYFIPENDQGSGRRIISRPLRWKLYEDEIGKNLSKLYKRLIFIRSNYQGLRSSDFYPRYWEEWQTQFNPDGYGIDTKRQLAIYHRWGQTDDGILQRFITVLNFSDEPLEICVPFPENGTWTDLLSNYSGSWKVNVTEYRFCFTIGSNWGHIFFK